MSNWRLAKINHNYANDEKKIYFQKQKFFSVSKSFTGLAVKDWAEVTKLFFKVGKGVLNDD